MLTFKRPRQLSFDVRRQRLSHQKKREKPVIRFSCPSCWSVLEHATAGEKLNCPHCGQRMQVPQPNTNKTVLAPLAPMEPLPKETNPHKNEGQKYCCECGELINARAEICPKCGVRQRVGSRFRPDPGWEPHRGTAILVMGILALFTIPFVLGPIAWIWANEDLRKMKAGVMDPEGQGSTEAGRICGMIATILSLVGVGLVFMYFFCLCGILAPMTAPQRGW